MLLCIMSSSVFEISWFAVQIKLFRCMSCIVSCPYLVDTQTNFTSFSLQICEGCQIVIQTSNPSIQKQMVDPFQEASNTSRGLLGHQCKYFSLYQYFSTQVHHCKINVKEFYCCRVRVTCAWASLMEEMYETGLLLYLEVWMLYYECFSRQHVLLNVLVIADRVNVYRIDYSIILTEESNTY